MAQVELKEAGVMTSANDMEPVSSSIAEDGKIELRRWDNVGQCYQVWPLTRMQAASLIGDLGRSLAIQ